MYKKNEIRNIGHSCSLRVSSRLRRYWDHLSEWKKALKNNFFWSKSYFSKPKFFSSLEIESKHKTARKVCNVLSFYFKSLSFSITLVGAVMEKIQPFAMSNLKIFKVHDQIQIFIRKWFMSWGGDCCCYKVIIQYVSSQ